MADFATSSSVHPAPAGNPAWAGLIDEWLDWLRARDRVRSAHTERAYRDDLTRWATAIAPDDGPGAPPPLERVTVADLRPGRLGTALGRLSRAYGPRTRQRMLSSLRGFCGWLVRQGVLARDPTEDEDVHLRRLPEQLPGAFTSAELRTLVETASALDPTARWPWPERDRAMVAVLAGSGVRASELCALRITDLARDPDPLLVVRGKGGKERRVPVAGEVDAAVSRYLTTRREGTEARAALRVDPGEPLFVRHDGTPLTPRALDYHVLKWIRRAGVAKPHGEIAHAFRHTYAKGLVANGVGLPSVQALLGHADLRTTSIYLRMTAAELMGAAQAADVVRHLRDTA